MDEREWVKNFLPNSTAKEIVNWLLETHEGEEQITQEEFVTRLAQFKQETGLGEVHLLQLRDYAEFEARLVSTRVDDPRRVVRHQIAKMALGLVHEHGGRL